jgi:hypothetical protein
MKIVLYFNFKVDREEIFKSTILNENIHQIINDNGIRSVTFAISRNFTVKSTMSSHRNIHKHIWKSPDERTHNQVDHIMIGEGIQVYLIIQGSSSPSGCAKVRERLAVKKNYTNFVWRSSFCKKIKR